MATITRFRAGLFTAADFASTGSAGGVAGDGSYATWTDSSRRGSTTGTFSAFDFSSLDLATILSVTLEIRDVVDVPGDFNNVTEDGTATSWVPAGAPTVWQVPLGTTLPSSVGLTFTRGNNTRQTIYSIDWCDAVVEYDPFEGSSLQAWTGTWTPGKLKKYNGSVWEPALIRRWDGSQWVEVL
jgi:hypothetical protein